MPPQLRRDFISAKWMSDFSSPGVEQAALAQFIGNGGFERHLRRSAMVLKERRRVLIDGLRACSHGRLEIEDSQRSAERRVGKEGGRTGRSRWSPVT